MKKVSKTKVLCLNYETALGSAVHATPVFKALKKFRPDWEVHVACSGVTASIFKHNPNIHKLHITDHPVEAPVKAALQLTKLGLQTKFNAVLLNSGNGRPKIAWNARLISSKKRIGVSADKWFININAESSKEKSVAANNLSLLKPLIAESDETAFVESFEVFYNKAASENVIRYRKTVAADKPLIGFVTQTSGGQPSEWWDERFSIVAKELRDKLDARMIFFGTGSEAKRITQIIQPVGDSAFSLAGKTSLNDIGAYVAACDLLISLDTGIMHIGRAVGVPMVVIAPAWQPEHEWLPLKNDQIKVLRRWDIACRNCLKFSCATRECMDEISPDEVVANALMQLKRFPPAEAAWKHRMDLWTVN